MSTGIRKRLLTVTLALASPLSTVAEVSFEQDLLPTLKRRCGACHITGDEPGNMALVPGRAYDSIVDKTSVEAKGMLRVAPGDAKASYLFHKVQGTHLSVGGSGVRMPMHQPPLPASFIERLAAWIEAGAPRN